MGDALPWQCRCCWLAALRVYDPSVCMEMIPGRNTDGVMGDGRHQQVQIQATQLLGLHCFLPHFFKHLKTAEGLLEKRPQLPLTEHGEERGNGGRAWEC